MDKTKLQDIPSNIRDIYSKAEDAGKKKNWDYAINLMKEVVNRYPALEPARECLRNYERAKSSGTGFIARLITKIKTSPKAAKIRTLIKKDPLAAMVLCENELASFLHNPLLLNLLADAAENAGALFISIESLEIIREFAPENEKNLRKLAGIYKKAKEPMKALQIFQHLANQHPNDLKIQAELRSATALASMHKGEWEKEGSTQEKTQQDAVAGQIEEGSIHDEDQATVLISKYEKELQATDSADIRRKLADAYYAAKRYDEAIEQFNLIAKMIGAMDPALDKHIEKAYLAKLDAMRDELKNNPDKYENPDQQLHDIEKHRQQYRKERALERVSKYPNDSQLHYDLAVIQFEDNAIDEALEQFQTARKNPQRKIPCLVYLGRCFLAKGQYDLAVEQLRDAVGQMVRMDKEKMAALYALGTTYEAAGDKDAAVECYKEIYQNNVNFRDVGAKIQASYSKRS